MKQIKIENNGVEQLITVPENSKVTIDGNVLVFEPKFKKGDIISFDILSTFIAIYKNENEYFVIVSEGGYIQSSNIKSFSDKQLRLSTDYEKQLLFDTLAKKGKQWNAEKLCIEDLKVVPKVGDCVKLYFKDKYIAYFVCKENGKFTPKKSFLCNVLENGYTVTNTNLELDYNGNCEYDIQEEQQFQSELAQLGFEYNFEDDTISELKWKPKDGELYYYIMDCVIIGCRYCTTGIDMARVDSGNYFKTVSICVHLFV